MPSSTSTDLVLSVRHEPLPTYTNRRPPIGHGTLCDAGSGEPDADDARWRPPRVSTRRRQFETKRSPLTPGACRRVAPTRFPSRRRVSCIRRSSSRRTLPGNRARLVFQIPHVASPLSPETISQGPHQIQRPPKPCRPPGRGEGRRCVFFFVIVRYNQPSAVRIHLWRCEAATPAARGHFPFSHLRRGRREVVRRALPDLRSLRADAGEVFRRRAT